MFRSNNYKKNALLISSAGIIQQVSQMLWTFIYRTVFLYFLSKDYYGLNGLFTNVLQLFSLAELGIGGSILYRMYKPVAEMNEKKIAAYMNFYKRVYHLIFIVVLLLGGCCYPFLYSVVNVSDIPSDINISVIYFLFVIQSASSYLYVYKQSIITANQKGYQISVFSIVSDILINSGRIIALVVTKDYEVVLLVGVLIQIIINYIFSKLITIKYSNIFSCKDMLSKGEKREIYSDTFGLMCHKVGGIVLNSTDNIVISKICGLISVGIYSNYSMIVTAVLGIITKVFGNFSPVIGNYAIKAEKNELYGLYLKLEFANLWLVGFTTSCLYAFFNPFIEVWLDKSFLLQNAAVILICTQYYLKASWIVTSAMIEGCGLFMKDKLRPIIESVINLIVSILMAWQCGIIGVFIGTIISGMCTYYWRGSYLLFKYSLEGSVRRFLILRIKWIGLTVLSCLITSFVQSLFSKSWLGLVSSGIIITIIVNFFYVLCMRKNQYYSYFRKIVINKCKKFGV